MTTVSAIFDHAIFPERRGRTPFGRRWLQLVLQWGERPTPPDRRADDDLPAAWFKYPPI